MHPLNYILCDRKVTIYRKERDRVIRKEVDGCYYHWQQVLHQTLGADLQDRDFLLVIPGQTQQVFVGDRVYDGAGPAAEEVVWERFLPATVAGLSQVSYVHPWHYGGQICHYEAG